MTTPSVPDFPAGSGPQQPQFQSWWTGPSTFFLDRIIARVTQQSSSTTLPDSGDAVTILFDTVVEDPYSGWDASTHSWFPPAGYSGWYMVTLRVGIDNTAGANVALTLQLNTSYTTYPDLVWVNLPSGDCSACAALPVFLTAGQDGVAGAASIQNSSSALSTVTTTGFYPTLEVVWLSS